MLTKNISHSFNHEKNDNILKIVNIKINEQSQRLFKIISHIYLMTSFIKKYPLKIKINGIMQQNINII